MTILSKQLRRDLETAIKQARDIAEAAAAEALSRIAVADAEAPTHLTEDGRALRRRLRAHGRAVGDTRDAAGVMTTARLQDAAAYEIWHRMLFGRFLVERGLLIHPELGAAISLAELRDLAHDDGMADEWALAEQYAAPGLPGVFKPDDPVLLLPIAPEFSKRMRAVLSGLLPEVFTADDSLGWTYQFWRGSEKDTVNAAGGKIGAVELPAVTQLFTESYMVKFLLHNTLGAWWAGKVLVADKTLARDAANEDALREACALPGIGWDFLRFVRNDDGKGPWRPAAGTFPGWPNRAAEITYCDPCCGSGHFLVEAFFILAALRRTEEGLSADDAAVSVLRDNLHGLEIDGRCVQIAAFNVALAAWKLTGVPIPLPLPHIAWVGAPPPMSRGEMTALADRDVPLRNALDTLYWQFEKAPLLGSLLEIGARDLLDADLRERGGAALATLRDAEPERAEGAVAARGLLDASALLSRHYVMLATNVPFLGRGKQVPDLADYISSLFPLAKADLATAMLERMRGLATANGTVAAVMPQNWLFLASYKELREKLLRSCTLTGLSILGEHGFDSAAAAGAFTALVTITGQRPKLNASFFGIDATAGKTPFLKAEALAGYAEMRILKQEDRLNSPDARIGVSEARSGKLLSLYCTSYLGLGTGDIPHYIRNFWEVGNDCEKWAYLQGSTETSTDWSGCESVVYWDSDQERVRGMTQGEREQIHNQDQSGQQAWKKTGVAVSLMRTLRASLFTGAKYEKSVAVLVPKNPDHVGAIFAFASSPEFDTSIREIDKKVIVANGTLVKVPFDYERWHAVFLDCYLNGLPQPYSAWLSAFCVAC